jgi:hypothetical protein
MTFKQVTRLALWYSPFETFEGLVDLLHYWSTFFSMMSSGRIHRSWLRPQIDFLLAFDTATYNVKKESGLTFKVQF